ncbi:Disease resistance protein [Melia azedarach]|uniref:Disease resistance protein n=1 Tax=Melia azedarach TaxID=155640 RepID=A0ACC1YRU4_MELAZ|nr:Disease resistance protein [Melia azedarach]
MVMDIVLSVVERVAECLFHAALQQLGYFLHHNHNIRTLRKQAEKLADMRDRVQRKIDTAKKNGEIIETDVQKWIASVNNITAEAEKFLDDEVRASKRCLKGWCVNLCSLYRFSKEALQKAKDISQILEEGKFKSVSRPAPPGIISSSIGVSGAFQSRQFIKKQIMEALNDDNVSIIGIYGMGGVGKTTVVKEIGKQATEHKLYDAVVMATLSQSPSVTRIQGEIASMLGLTLSGNNENARARMLWERIKEKKRILVILDDVWGRIDLEMIGIPFQNDHPGCKILLTSRRKDVCHEMDAQMMFTVDTLSIEESWILFREVAGKDIENSDINLIARKVAATCGGLPIAILTVGRALKNKEKGLWIDALRQLEKSNPSNIKGMQESVFFNPGAELQLFTERGGKIILLALLLLSRGFSNSSRTVGKSKCRTFGREEAYVKMRDVVRDVALKIASKDRHRFMVKASMGLREWPNKDTFEDLKAISLMSNDIHDLPDRLECPKLQALLLQQNSPLVFADSFFQEVEDLKVLDLSYIQLLPLPPSLSLLTNLRTLCLIGCQLGDLSLVGKLTNLEILSLSHSDIEEIPVDFGQLAHLRLFDLRMCENLKLISHGVISCLQKLEEFYAEHSLINDERGGDLRTKAVLLELKALGRLTNLDIFIPNISVLPDDMPFQNLTSFSIAINQTSHFNRYSCSRSMSLSLDMSNPLPSCVKNLLNRTESLYVFHIQGSKNILPDLDNDGFGELKFLEIQKSYEVIYLINTLEWAAHGALCNLEELNIRSMDNLVEICRGPLPAQSFSKTKRLSVIGCQKMLHIVPSHLLQRLQNLKSFSASNCGSVAYAFDLEGLGIAKVETKLLSLLETLTFSEMYEMTHIWKGDTQVISLCNLKEIIVEGCLIREVFPLALQQSLNSLEYVRINRCPNLEEIFGKNEEKCQDKEVVLWKKDCTITTPSLGNLTGISIYSCFKLKYLFTPSIVKSLAQLKSLRVFDCASMQEIIIDMKGESTEMIVFPSLYEVRLVNLSSLTCFYPGLCTIEFPALEILSLWMCPKMKTFGYGGQVTPKLNKVEIWGRDEERWMVDLNTTLQQLSNEWQVIYNAAEGSSLDESEQSPEDTGAETRLSQISQEPKPDCMP